MYTNIAAIATDPSEKKDIILNPETKRSGKGRQNESVICGILHVRGSPAGRSQKRIYTHLQHQLPAAFAMIELDHLILPPPLATVFERDLTTTTLAPPWPFPAQLPRNPRGTSALSGQVSNWKNRFVLRLFQKDFRGESQEVD